MTRGLFRLREGTCFCVGRVVWLISIYHNGDNITTALNKNGLNLLRGLSRVPLRTSYAHKPSPLIPNLLPFEDIAKLVHLF